MTDRERIIDKVRKLQAMAEGDGTTEAEAQAFAAKVQELMTAYKLSQTDIGTVNEDEPIGQNWVSWQHIGLPTKHTRVAWSEALGAIIGKAYYCQHVVPKGKYARQMGILAGFVGTDSDREVCLYMFATIARFLVGLAERETKKFNRQAWIDGGRSTTGSRPVYTHNFKAGFILGFISRLKERFMEEVNPDMNKNNCMAIVVVRDKAQQRNREWMDQKGGFGDCRLAKMERGSMEGHTAGRAEADKLDLGAKALKPGKAGEITWS